MYRFFGTHLIHLLFKTKKWTSIFFSKDFLNKTVDLNFFKVFWKLNLLGRFFCQFFICLYLWKSIFDKKIEFDFLILIFRLWKEIFHRFGCVPKRGLSKVQGIKGDMTDTLPRKEQARLEPEQRSRQTHPLNFIYITMNKMPKYT